MNLGDAIKTALEFEHKVMDVYSKYADKLNSPVGAKIFKLLGKEEEGHADYLKAKLAEWQKSGKITVDKLETIVPDKNLIEDNVKKLKKVAKQESINDEIEVFKKALKMESDASAFYRDLVGKLPAKDQKLFQHFIEIEEGHEAIVKAEIDNAQGMGFWFDFMEFNLESA
ncbi:ferritin family protein [bacterium]|nr:ferritin family protein [bacterium]